MESLKIYLDKMKTVAPGNYDLHLMLSIWYFVAERDIANAMKEIRKCNLLRKKLLCSPYIDCKEEVTQKLFSGNGEEKLK